MVAGHSVNDSSVPMGFFNSVAFPEVLNIENEGNPNLTCTEDDKKLYVNNTASGCMPNPLTIPNPYSLPVRPPPSPHVDPVAPRSDPVKGTNAVIIICAAIGLVILLIIAIVLVKKYTNPPVYQKTDDQTPEEKEALANKKTKKEMKEEAKANKDALERECYKA